MSWDCDGCPEPLDRSRPHVVVTQQMEVRDGDGPDAVISVSEVHEVGLFHPGCAPQVAERIGGRS